MPAATQPSTPTVDLTGVDEELAGLADLTVTDHVQVFDRIHQRLTDVLGVTGAAASESADVRPDDTGSARVPGQSTSQRGH